MSPREASVALAACSCVLLAVVAAASEIKVYKKVGDYVVFNPVTASVPGAVTYVVWKHNNSLALEFDNTGIDSYRQFKERGSLNQTSGAMTLRGLTRTDSGLYTSEIRGVESPDIRLIVISPVPEPSVGTSCDEESASCTLTCDGDTADAGPVTCRWRRDDKWTTGSQALLITKEGSSGVAEFSCELENPVSRESSRPVANPFSTTPGGKLKISTAVTVFIALLVGVLLLIAFHRCKTGMWFFQKTSMPWEPKTSGGRTSSNQEMLLNLTAHLPKGRGNQTRKHHFHRQQRELSAVEHVIHSEEHTDRSALRFKCKEESV